LSAAWFGLAGVLGAGVAVAAVREVRWRSRAARELAGELALGTMRPEDLEALVSWARFGKRWLAGRAERRAFRRFARRLVSAKEIQAAAPPARRKLLQVQVLTLRTRLRAAAPRAAALAREERE